MGTLLVGSTTMVLMFITVHLGWRLESSVMVGGLLPLVAYIESHILDSWAAVVASFPGSPLAVIGARGEPGNEASCTSSSTLFMRR